MSETLLPEAYCVICNRFVPEPCRDEQDERCEQFLADEAARRKQAPPSSDA